MVDVMRRKDIVREVTELAKKYAETVAFEYITNNKNYDYWNYEIHMRYLNTTSLMHRLASKSGEHINEAPIPTSSAFRTDTTAKMMLYLNYMRGYLNDVLKIIQGGDNYELKES